MSRIGLTIRHTAHVVAASIAIELALDFGAGALAVALAPYLGNWVYVVASVVVVGSLPVLGLNIARVARREWKRHHPGRGYTRLMVTKDDVFEALHQVEDPELGTDIVELGLLYDVEIEGPKVKVIHSLTSMGCPAGPMIQEDIHRVTAELPGVDDVEIELTWDPPWTPERMSDDAKFILGFG